MKFAPEYVTHVLNENFEDAKELLLSPLMAINYAHLVMLAEQGIISAAEARALRDALDGISLEKVRASSLRRHLRGPVLLHREPDRSGLRRRRRRPAAYRPQPQRPGDDDVPDGAAGVSRRDRRSDAEPARRAARARGASHRKPFTARTPTRSRRSRRRSRITCWRSSSSSNATPFAWPRRSNPPITIRLAHARSPGPGSRSIAIAPASCLASAVRPATPTAASPPSTTCWRARRRPAC